MEKKNEPTLRVVPMPSDSNSNGDIFGGSVAWASNANLISVGSGGRDENSIVDSGAVYIFYYDGNLNNDDWNVTFVTKLTQQSANIYEAATNDLFGD